MSNVLDKATIGEPVVVTIAGVEHRLEYRFAAILAFQEKTGDSLFDRAVYPKIDLSVDPRRWLACLWAGLHTLQADGTWKAPYTFEELSGKLDLDATTAGAISRTMVQAMVRYFPKPDLEKKSVEAETSQPSTSSSSGLERADATASAQTNS